MEQSQETAHPLPPKGPLSEYGVENLKEESFLTSEVKTCLHACLFLHTTLAVVG